MAKAKSTAKSAAKPKALGRGLSALMPKKPPAPPAESAAGAARLELPVAQIAPNPEQPRRVFTESELASLAASLRRHGVLQPVVVRRAPPESAADAPYQLVVGERRWRAAQRAGLQSIPATVQELAPEALLEVALVENVQRSDLNPVELALAFRALCDAGLTQAQVGERVGMERATVTNYLRLLELPRAMQQDVERGEISVGHAKVLLSVQNSAQRRRLRERIQSAGLSVRAAESAARELAAGGGGATGARAKTRGAAASSAAGAVDWDAQALIRELEGRLQTKVRLQGGKGESGRIEISYHNSEELQRITDELLA